MEGVRSGWGLDSLMFLVDVIYFYCNWIFFCVYLINVWSFFLGREFLEGRNGVFLFNNILCL